MTDDARFRIGHPERDHARRVLEEAFRRGYIDADEYEWRSSALDAAVLHADLGPVIGDLGLVGLPSEDAPPVEYVERVEITERRPLSHQIMDGVGAAWSIAGLLLLVVVVIVCCSVFNDL